MCDCFHLAFPNWHAASSGTECRVVSEDVIIDDQRLKGKQTRLLRQFSKAEIVIGDNFLGEVNQTEEVHSPESGLIVKTAKDGCAEGLVYGGGGKEGIFIKEVVPESPASKSLKLKEGDQILSATVYFDNVSYEDAIQILEHAQAYRVKLCLKRKPDITDTETAIESDIKLTFHISVAQQEEDVYDPEMREQGKTKRRGDARFSWPKFPSFGKGKKSRFTRSHSTSEADEQRKLELSPTTSDTESPIKSQDALKGKKKHKIKLSVLTKRGRISSSEDQDTDAPTSAQMVSPECLESPSGETPQIYATEDLKVVEDLRQIRGEVKGVEYKEHTFKLPEFGAVTENISINVPDAEKDKNIDGADIRTLEREGKSGKFKMPTLSISMPKVKGPEIDLSLSEKDVELTLPEEKAEVDLPDIPEVEVTLGNVDVSIPKKMMDVKKPELNVKPWQTVGELEGQGSKFKEPKFGIKMPKLKGPEFDLSLSKKDVDVRLPEVKSEVKLPETPKIDASFGKAEVLIPEAKVEVKKPEVKIKPLHTDVELERQGGKFQMPKFGIMMPKVKGPEIDLSLSKKGVGVTLPEAKAEVKLPEAPEIDATLGKINVSIPKQKMEVEKPELEIKPLRTEGELDGQGAKAEVKPPDVEQTEHGIKVDVKAPETAVYQQDVEGSSSKFKMPTFKLPTFGVGTPNVSVEAHVNISSSKKDVDVTLPEAGAEVKLPETPKTDASLGKAEVLFQEAKMEVKKPEVKIKPLHTDVEFEGQGDTFQMPKFGITMPKVKGPEIHFSLSKKDVDLTLPEAKADVKVPEVELNEPSAKVEIKAPEIKVTEKDTEGSPSKFKMPTFKLPKFGVGTPDISVEVSDMDKDVKTDGADIKIPEDALAVDIAAPSIDIEGPSIDIKTTGTEHEGKGSKFKLPSLGFSGPQIKRPDIDLSLSKKDVDGTLPVAKADVKFPDVHTEAPSIDIEGLSTDRKTTGIEEDGKGSFKMPHLSFSMPKVKGPNMDFSLSNKDVDVKLTETKPDVKLPEVDLGKVDVSIPEAKMEVKKPEVEKQFMQTKGELDGKGEKFEMPKFGIKMPKLKEPEFDLSLTKRDIDIPLPETKVEVKHTDAPKIDVSLGKAEVLIPEAKAKVEEAELDVKPLQTEVKGQGSELKMPKFGMSMPQVKGPEFHLGLSKKDIDVRIPEAKADVNFPDIELKKPSAEVEMKAPVIEVLAKDTEGSPSKFKMPNLSFSMPKVKGPDVDVSLSKKDTDITLPGTKAEIKLPETPKIDASLGKAEVLITEAKMEDRKTEMEIKPLQTGIDIEGHGGKFQMPKFGIKMPKVKGPEIDLSFPKKDVDVTLPEAKADVELPEASKIAVDMKPSECEAEIDGQGGKFKIPKFGISMHKVKGPDFDSSLSKKDADITLPEAKAEVNLPDVELKEPSAKVEIKAPDIETQLSSVKGSPSKFKLPTFKFPKFGAATPNVSAKLPDIDTEIKIDGADMHISVPHTDVDVPEVKAEVHLPEVEVKKPSGSVVIEQQQGVEVDAKLKKTRFSLPRFSFSKPSVKSPEVDARLQDAKVAIPEGKVEVNVLIPEAKAKVEEAELDVKPLQTEVKGQGSELKMPKFGMSMPKVKGPEFHLGLSKKDIDVRIPEAKADVNFPDVELKQPSAEVEMKAPVIEVLAKDTEGSPSKFKMPNFSFSMPKVKGPDVDVSLSKKDTDITLPGTKAELKLPETPKIDASLGKAEILIPEERVEVKKPEVKIKPLHTDVELEGHRGKFQMPKFGIKMPKVKGPEIDLSFPKNDVDVTLPEAKADVELPEASKIAVDMKPSECEAEIDGQGGKFKMPKFGISMPKVKGPEIDFSLSKKDVDLTLPDAKAEVNLPDVELKEPSAEVEIKAPDIEAQLSSVKGSPSKFQLPTFKFPKFGIATPNVSTELPNIDTEIKIDGADMHISVPHTDVDVPEVKAEVHLPEVEVKKPSGSVVIEQQQGVEVDAKLKKTRFSLPRFSFSKPSVKSPEVDASLQDAKVAIPEGKVEVNVLIPEAKAKVEEAELDVKPLQTEVKGQGSEFKMPKFGMSMPKVKGPEFHLGLSKKDIDVRIPEAKADVNFPDVELKQPSAEVEMKAPVIEVSAKDTEGSPSKFKMPNFSFSLPKVKGPDVDVGLSEKDTDITLPGTKAELKLPETPKIDASLGKAEVLIPEERVEVKKPEVKIKPLHTDVELEGHRGKFQMPKFGIKMPKVKGPEIDLSFPKKDVDVTLPEAKADVELQEASKIAVDMKPSECEAEIDGQGGKFKMPKFGISMPKMKGPEIDFSLSKKDVDLTLPDAKAEVNLPDVELKEPSAEVEIKAPDIEAQLSSVKGSPSKFQLPTFKFPKFGIATPNVSTELPNIDTEIKIDGADMHISVPHTDVDVPEVKAEVHLPEVEVKKPSGSVVIEQQQGVEVDAKLKKTRFSLPRFSFSKPSVKSPEVDASLQDAKVAIPEGKVEVNVLIPEAKAKVEEAELDVKPLQTEVKGEGSELKMPKFGMSMPKVKGPEFHLGLSKKDIDVRIPEAKADVNFPDVELKQSSAEVEMKAPVIEVLAKDTEGSPSKFKMPNLSFSMPKVKGPDVDVSLSKKDTDITLPGTKAELKLPETPKIDASLGKAEVLIPEERLEVKKPEVKIKPLHTDVELEGHRGKFQMPKFGIKMPKVKGPEIDLSFPKKDVDATLPEAKADVELPEASKIAVDMKPSECEAEIDGQGGKFKMPKFGISMPKVKGPEIDFSLSKKDVDFTLPDTKAEVNLPDVELKEPSAKVEIKAPDTEAQLSSVKGSPSKFQLPTFKFPKFGAATPNVSTELPDIDTEIKIDGADMHMSVPHTDVDVPEVKAEVHLPEVEVKKPSGSVVIEQQQGVEVDAKLKKTRFSLPRFSFSKTSVKVTEVDASLQDANVAIPEGEVEVKGTEVDMKLPDYEAEVDGQGSRFKMPKFAISMPKIKGPEIDLSLSKKDVDVTLPEAKAEVQLSDVKIKQPAVEIKAPEIEAHTGNTEGSPSKLKMPTFTLPIFGAATPKVIEEVPDVDKDIKIEGAKVDVTAPSIDTEGLSVDVKAKGSEFEGSGSKFKMPKFGISMPKVKGPEIDLSLSKKDVDVPLPEAKAKIELPNVAVKESEVEIKSPEIKVAAKGSEGSPSKFKMPTFKLPKFGVGTPSATVDVPDTDRDVKTNGADIKIPEEVLAVDIAAPSIDTEGPSIDIKTTGTEHEGKGSMFKLPSLGFSGPQIKRPDIDLDLSKIVVDVTLPEAKAGVKLPHVEVKESSAKVEIKAPGIDVQTKGNVEVKQPEVELKPPEGDVELEGQESKFKMPLFGFSTPKVKGPEIDLSLSKKDVDVKLPKAKAEVQFPDVKIKQQSATVEIKAPEIEAQTGDVEGSQSKLKMPTFTLPKFGAATPKVSVEELDVDKDIKIDGATVDVNAPSIDTKGLSVDVKAKGSEIEGSGSKFKMPKFGISMPKVKGPEIDLSLSKKDVDVKLPEAKAEVQLPDVKIKQPSATVEIKAPEIEAQTGNVEGSPSKLKMPTFTLPKFGAATPKVSVEVPDVDKDIKIDGATVDATAPSIDTKGLSVDVKAKGSEFEGSGSKFKMPKFGISMPKVKGPEIDLSLSKKDVDVKLPEAKAEVQLPDVKIKQPSATVEIKVPEIEAQTGNVEGSPSKLKMPTFTLPKFGAATPKVSVEVPDVDKDIKIDGATVDVTAPSIDTKGLSVDVKAKGSEFEGSGSKFKMPKFGISMPKVKGPEIDLSLSKKDVDVKLPEAKAEVQLPDVKIKQPSATVEIKAPEIEAQTGNVEGSPSKLKMPTFTLPKFGAATPKVSVEVPDVDKDIKIDGATVDVTAPSIDTKGLSVDVKAKGSEFEGSGSKFKMPKFGISMPKVKGPEIDLSLSKKDVDVKLPEAKAEVQLPDVKIKQPSATVEIKVPEIEAQTGNVEGSPSKLKMPTFTLPKFGAATPKVSVEVPDVDKDIKIDGATVDVTAPSIDTKGLSVDVKAKGSEFEGSGSKFKMPKFGISMPKVKGPEIDLSLSKKDVDVKLPEAKAEVQLPDVKIKQPSATVEIKVPEIEAQTGNVEGSPSKLKMPTFTLPKFGAATPKVSVEVPDVDKDIKIDGATVDVTAPSIDTKGLSVDVKAKGSEFEGSGSKFKMPKFGISMPKVKGPEIDLSLSKKDVDVKLPEAKAEVQLPDVKIKQPSATVEIKVPEIEAQTGNVEGSPSKLKMPTFTLPKFGAATPKVSVEVPDVDKDIKIDGATVDVTAPSIDTKGLSVDVKAKGSEIEGSGSKFKMPKFGISMPKVKGPEIDLSLSKKDVDVKLPEAKSEIKLPNVEVKESEEREVIVKQPEIKMKAPELEAENDGQESKFKLPKYGIALPKAKGPEQDVNASQKDVGITLPEVKAEVKLPEIEVKESSASVEMKASESEAKSKGVGGSTLKFKMPTLKMPKFGVATYDVTAGAPDADKVAETDGAKLKEDVTVNVKGPSVDIKTDVSKEAITGSETLKTETESVDIGSPSKFKLPSFKMPKLSFSRPNPEDEHVPVDTECKDQVEMEVEPKGESKSAKVTLTSFGEILKNIDVEFDVPKTEENLETSKDVHETDKTSGKQLEAKEKETTTKSPERTGWFKFPKFGLSSPSEPAKISEKDTHKDEKTPVEGTVEEISPTFSVQSSDAFADISSAMTSEHVGLSLSSPTKSLNAAPAAQSLYTSTRGATSPGASRALLLSPTIARIITSIIITILIILLISISRQVSIYYYICVGQFVCLTRSDGDHVPSASSPVATSVRPAGLTAHIPSRGTIPASDEEIKAALSPRCSRQREQKQSEVSQRKSHNSNQS
ncbi:neuroblast differentiation-associated protein AHNAK-like [Perca flavescens]|uniref:neuroblast differentiation-associated protein AHNAK-like n=1 Tax=Perca flavescens TaxID=8167 RepID=UPI00106EB9AE|nr:neuroblast differentiation-associated protein AHNAK-like [Perca flavescens]